MIPIRYEAIRRVRSIHISSGPCVGRSAFCYQTASGRASQAISAESEQARTEIESCHILRFGPRFKVLVGARRRHLAGDLGPSQTLAYDLTNCQVKALTVIAEPASTCWRTSPCNAFFLRFGTTEVRTLPPRSRMPITAVLSLVPVPVMRRAYSCLSVASG